MDRLASSFILSFFGKDRNAGSWQLGGTPIEIHAPTERYSHPAICIDSEFSRIIGFQEETNIQIEMDRLSAGIHCHGGTYAYKIHDAVFFKDSVVKGNKNFGGRRISRIKSIFGRYEYMDEALLCSNDLTDRYFGHWLRDSLGRVDKRDSQTRLVLIQDCFLRGSHGSRGFVGRGVGSDRAATAA